MENTKIDNEAHNLLQNHRQLISFQNQQIRQVLARKVNLTTAKTTNPIKKNLKMDNEKHNLLLNYKEIRSKMSKFGEFKSINSTDPSIIPNKSAKFIHS